MLMKGFMRALLNQCNETGICIKKNMRPSSSNRSSDSKEDDHRKLPENLHKNDQYQVYGCFVRK